MIKYLNDLIQIANSQSKKKIVVAAAADLHVLEALKEAISLGIPEPILVGDKTQIKRISKSINLDLKNIEIIDEPDSIKASMKSVTIIRKGKAAILMKGLVATGTLLKAVLDKEKGLQKGGLLSHVAFFETPYYHKILCLTDAAMNIKPNIDEKVAIVKNAVEACRKLGIEKPKVAILAAVETVNPKMEATLDAALLTQMNKRNQIKNCEIDGPLALDNIISKEAAEHKGIQSKVAGDADIILAPDINVGNVFYKSLNFMGGAVSAAVIMGARVPIILTSRSDSEKSKLMSIVLATAMKE
jgi:phosphate butyryltransferase